MALKQVLVLHSPHHNHVPVVGELEEFDKVVALLDLGRDRAHPGIAVILMTVISFGHIKKSSLISM